MSIPVTLLAGDTTGPDIWRVIKPLYEDAGSDIDWQVVDTSSGVITDAVVESVRRNQVALMAYHHGLRDEGQLPPVVALRKRLGVYANLRPLVNLAGIEGVCDGVDIIVVRETSEDVYSGNEHESIPGVFESLKVTTRSGSERIARYAFEVARKNGRKKVTVAHKANIMKKSDGLFLRTAMSVADEYEDIDVEECIVDALCMKLVLDPSRFDVLLCGNLFGDIVSDLCTGLVGGPINAPSINRASDAIVFTVGHGDHPGSIPASRANPIPLLLTSLYLMEHIGEQQARQRLGDALEQAVLDGVRPLTMGGDADCESYVAAVRERLR